ncbi:MAG TPA: DUF4386 family protein [Dehalococcoidia bacterium]|nr:DUF4386 family protein [Dehalococcoidia bacterium]
MATRLADTDISSDNFRPVIVAIGSHRDTYALSAAFGALGVACFVPMILAVWESTDAQDKPFAVMVGLFMLISAGLLLDAYAHQGNLVGTAADYINYPAMRDVIVIQADQMGDQAQILEYAGLVSFGISLLLWSWLMTRSAVYPKALSWLTWGLGLLCFASVIQPAPMIAVRLVWAVALGAIWLRVEGPATIAEAEPTP